MLNSCNTMTYRFDRSLEQTLVSCDDFHSVFRRYPVPQDDFVFLDPPYDTEFSTYGKNAFSRADHQRLTRYLLEACAGRFMLVIKHTACANGRRIRGAGLIKNML